MKKILYFVACCGIVAAVGASCHSKTVAATPGAAAKKSVEYIMNNDYERFVDQISFIEPVAPAYRKATNRTHATALRAIHHPDITRHGGIKEVRVVSEKMSPDNRTCDVRVASHYNDGMVKNVDMHMINDNKVWKVRETPYKEIWRATTTEGDTEVLKVRSGHERDFVKDKEHETGKKQFLKDVQKRDGQVEVVKVMEDGRRHREVIKTLDESNREIDKLKIDTDKVDAKDIDHTNREILKDKEKIDGERARNREVIKK